MFTSGILTLSICLSALLGDTVLDVTSEHLFRALIDSFTHGLIGLFSWAVYLMKSANPNGNVIIISRIFEVILSGFLASFIDVDHFVYNRSLDVNSALHLGEHRPILHCTTLILVSCLVPYLYSQVYGVFWLTRLCWLAFVSMLSHHIRDATRRGLWLYPFGSTRPLPKHLYIGLLAVLPHTAFYMAANLDKNYNFNAINQVGNYLLLRELYSETKTMNPFFLIAPGEVAV